MFNHTDQSDGRSSRSASTEQTDRLYIGGGQSGLYRAKNHRGPEGDYN